MKRDRRKYSEEELIFIRNNYYKMTRNELGKLLDRNPTSVSNVSNLMGLYKKPRWADDDDSFLVDNYSCMTLESLCEALGKTESSIYHRIQDLGLQTKKEHYDYISDKDLLEKLKQVSDDLGRVPIRSELTSLGLPSEIVFSRRFGSYGDACEMSGLTKNSGFVSYQVCYSIGGDKCLSNAEKKITDFLIMKGIPFNKEVPYSDICSDSRFGKMVCDWHFGGNVVAEYFGMSRNKKYKKSMNKKIILCSENGINLISIFDKDLNNLDEIFCT